MNSHKHPVHPKRQRHSASRAAARAAVGLLILSDGTVLAHNLTPKMAKLLAALNPRDAGMAHRAKTAARSMAKLHL